MHFQHMQEAHPILPLGLCCNGRAAHSWAAAGGKRLQLPEPVLQGGCRLGTENTLTAYLGQTTHVVALASE